MELTKYVHGKIEGESRYFVCHISTEKITWIEVDRLEEKYGRFDGERIAFNCGWHRYTWFLCEGWADEDTIALHKEEGSVENDGQDSVNSTRSSRGESDATLDSSLAGRSLDDLKVEGGE